jgi:SAM-dependent methyltransferase
MTNSQFEVYASSTFDKLGFTEQAGRYEFQSAAERLILPDVMNKLQIERSDTLLDVGCGPGNLLIPLSFMVAQATGIDSPPVIERLSKRFSDPKIRLIGGLFPDVDFPNKFSKIVSYSVLHYIADLKGARAFVAAIADLLAPGGRALIGDLPNTNAKTRNAKAADAASQSVAWQGQIDAWRRDKGDAHPFDEFCGKSGISGFTDKDIAGFITDLRGNGFDAYWLPQPSELPFGRTREDLLIVRR